MKNKIYIFFIAMFVFGQIAAQNDDNIQQDVNVDDLGNVTDEFQEYFFEALKQKGIENHEKAITALKKCAEINPDMPVVFFELGKNYKALENYDIAIDNLSKAHKAEPGNKDILAELYDAFYLERDYINAIVSVKKLIEHDPNYSEDLANLYLLTRQYDDALAVLDELDQNLGHSNYRDNLRKQVYALSAKNSNQETQISVLKKRISESPENEKNYLNLIYVYSEGGEDEKAFQTAQQLVEVLPGSELAHLALYKFYLEKSQPEAAVASMKIVLQSDVVDSESKYKVLNDFLIFVNANEEYRDEMEEVVSLFSETEESALVYEKLGQYYLEKKMLPEALEYFKMGLREEPDNFHLLKQATLLQIDAGNFSEAKEISTSALDYYPSQPLFYLLNGAVLNHLSEYKKAEEALLYGLDYLIDDRNMEADFYKQLSITYKGLNNTTKAAKYEERALSIKKDN